MDVLWDSSQGLHYHWGERRIIKYSFGRFGVIFKIKSAGSIILRSFS
jgi:hypothetical protein